MTEMIEQSKNKFLYYILLLAANIALTWWVPYFPSQDGPSHVYNLVILKDLLNGGKEWGDYFTFQLRAAPNLGFNLVAYPLLYLFSPQVVEKLFISVYIALMGLSVPLFLRAFDKQALPLAYFVFPVIFNFNLMMGFYSFAIGVTLFLLAFSYSWRLRNRSIGCKFIVYNLSGLTIFYFHLIPFLYFLLALAIISIAETDGIKSTINNMVKLLVIISPSAILLLYYLNQGSTRLPSDISYLTSAQRSIDLLRDLISFSTMTFYQWQLYPASILLITYLFLLSLVIMRPNKNHSHGRLIISVISPSEKLLVCFSTVLTAIYLYAPFSLGEGSFFNQRFPWVILLVTLPLLQIPEIISLRRLCSIVMVGVACLFLAINVVILRQQSAKVEHFLSGLHAGLPEGAFVMTYKAMLPESPRIDVLVHAASYYGIYKGCVDLGNYETAFPCFPVHFKDGLPALPSQDQINYRPATINFPDYTTIHYLIGWELNSVEQSKLATFFQIIWQDGPLSIWQKIAAK